jgi:hypothetical protein
MSMIDLLGCIRWTHAACRMFPAEMVNGDDRLAQARPDRPRAREGTTT